MGSKARVFLLASVGGLLLFNTATSAAALVILGRVRSTDTALRSRFVASNARHVAKLQRAGGEDRSDLPTERELEIFQTGR